MPAKSAKQYGLMAGVMSGSISGKNKNIPHSVASEIVHNTPSKKRRAFAKNLKNSKKKGDKK